MLDSNVHLLLYRILIHPLQYSIHQIVAQHISHFDQACSNMFVFQTFHYQASHDLLQQIQDLCHYGMLDLSQLLNIYII